MVKPQVFSANFASPLGKIYVSATKRGVTSLDFRAKPASKKSLPVLRKCAKELSEYFAGKRTRFSVPLDLSGTEFQKKCWKSLRGISFSTTKSYKRVAAAVRSVRHSRAAARAISQNPVMIIVPCHRVIAGNGGISGFAGGVWRKKWLLKHETAKGKKA